MNAEQEFADGKFKIECREMVLTKNGGPPLVVHGPGEIWQNEEGVLQFKVFADRAGFAAFSNNSFKPVVAGQLVPDEDYFTLAAHDYSLPENQWIARRVLPWSRGASQDGLAYGDLSQLELTQERLPEAESDLVVVRLREKIKFPSNISTHTSVKVGGQDRKESHSFNAARVVDGEFRFEFHHESEHTVVTLQMPKGRLTTSTPLRIHESLQFFLGQQLALMVIETTSGGLRITRLLSPDRGRGMISPPLQFGRVGDPNRAWNVFSCYFRHIHQDTKPTSHPISLHIGRATEANAASLETSVLALAVAAEGVAGDCFSKTVPVSPDFLRDLTSIEAAAQALPLQPESRPRIAGSLKAMRSPRNSDVLRVFIANNHLPPGLYKSWVRLRNASAHGGGAGGRDIETVLRLRSEVVYLLYSLIFSAINYVGLRTDYSQPGYPVVQWPILPAPAVAPDADAWPMPSPDGPSAPPVPQ